MANSKEWIRHNLPLGTIISIKGERCYEVADYQELLGPCPPDCTLHDGGDDCYEEPYITVRDTTRRAFPISKVDTIFDQPNHVGRKPTKEDFNGTD